MTHQLHFHCIPASYRMTASNDIGKACGEHTVDQLTVLYNVATRDTGYISLEARDMYWPMLRSEWGIRTGGHMDSARRQNCPSHLIRYREFREVELRSLRQNTSSRQRRTAAP